MPIVGVGPFKGLKGFIPEDQCQVGIDPIPQIRPVGISLRRGKNNMSPAEISGVNIHPALSISGRISLFEVIRCSLNFGKGWNRNKLLKSDEPPEKRGSHLLAVIIRLVKRESLTQSINLSEYSLEDSHALFKDFLL